MNLLRDEKPPQWKEIKFSTSIIHNMVFPVIGAVDVLKQMGYTEVHSLDCVLIRNVPTALYLVQILFVRLKSQQCQPQN